MFVRMGKDEGRRALCACLGAAAIVLAPNVSVAEGGGVDTAQEGGLGAAAAISSLVYGPVKVLWAAGGTVIGGLAWVFTAGDTEVAQTVVTRAVRGTYVITPETLQGREEIEFVGRSPEYRPTPAGRPAQVAVAPDGW